MSFSIKNRAVLCIITAFLLAACNGEDVGSSSSSRDVNLAQTDNLDDELRDESNSGFFVKVGDRVYFRRYGEHSFDGELDVRTAFNSTDFINRYNADTGSIISYYDETTGKVIEGFADDGYGKLYYYEGRFYLTEALYTDTGFYKSIIYSVAEDGSDRKDIAEGKIEFIDKDNGNLIVSDRKSSPSSKIRLIDKDGTELALFNHETSGGSYVVGSDELGVFVFVPQLSEEEESSGEVIYYRADKDTEPISVGHIDAALEDGSHIEIVELIKDGEDVHILAYESSGSIYADNNMLLFKAKMGGESPIELIDENFERDFEDLPSAIKSEKIDEKLADYVSNKVWHEAGDFYHGKSSKKQVVQEDVFKELEFATGLRYIVQSIEHIGGHTYCIYSLARFDEAESMESAYDIYNCMGLRYVKMDKSGLDVLAETKARQANLVQLWWIIDDTDLDILTLPKEIMFLDMMKIVPSDQSAMSRYGLEAKDFKKKDYILRIDAYSEYIASLAENCKVTYYPFNKPKSKEKAKESVEAELKDMIDYIVDSKATKLRSSLPEPAVNMAYPIPDTDRNAVADKESVLAYITYNMDAEIEQIKEIKP